MKRLPSMLDIKTDRVDHTASAGKRVHDGLPLVNVGLDRLKVRIIGTKQLPTAIRMS
jgi:hypothetical protein